MRDFPQPPAPPVEPWKWDEEVTVDGERYRANWLDSPDERWTRTVVLRGLPAVHRRALLADAQSSPTPHAWRVGDPVAPSEVDDALVARAQVLFDKDAVDLDSAFLTWLGVRPDGSRQLFGCAAARKRINPGYDSRGWIVLGRLLARSEVRGTGLGNHFTFHFFGCSQTLCGNAALGAFIPTETEQTRKLCRRAVENGFLDMVPMGVKRWPVLDTVFEVEVYLSFYPGMRDWLMEQARSLPQVGPRPAAVLLDAVEDAWRSGYDAGGGARLGELFKEYGPMLRAVAKDQPVYGLHLDFLESARAMGTLNPL